MTPARRVPASRASSTYTFGDGDFTSSRDPGNVYTWAGGTGGTYYAGTGGASIQLIAPIRLPQGAVLDSMVVHFNDSDADADLLVQLAAKTIGVGTAGLLGTVTSSGSAGTDQETTALSYTVNNTTYAGFYLVVSLTNRANSTVGWPGDGTLSIEGGYVSYHFVQ